MSLSSNKSKECYNRSAQKNVANELLDEHFIYDPNEPTEDPCDHPNCDYCNPPLGPIYRNKLIMFLAKLRVLQALNIEEYFYW